MFGESLYAGVFVHMCVYVELVYIVFMHVFYLCL